MTDPNVGFMDRNHFLIRRLHSLTGIVPIGAFLFPHLTTNSSIMWGSILGASHLAEGGHAGVETFQHEVNFIHSMPFLILIEIMVLWLPIAFHGILGFLYVFTGRMNAKSYPYVANWRYVLQRVSGILGLFFIFVHVASLRWGWSFFGMMPDWDGLHAASTTAAHFQDGSTLRTIAMCVIYLVCVSALVYHFANGLWTAAITWGVTRTVAAQQRWGYICVLVGLGLGSMGVASVIGFATVDIDHAYKVETQMLIGHTSADTADVLTTIDEDHPNTLPSHGDGG